MSTFRVVLVDTEPAAAITHDGYLGKSAKFHIQRLSDRKTFLYEGHGGGRRFELRCQLMSNAGGVLVDVPDPLDTEPDLSWKEFVVNQAMEEAEKLQ